MPRVTSRYGHTHVKAPACCSPAFNGAHDRDHGDRAAGGRGDDRVRRERAANGPPPATAGRPTAADDDATAGLMEHHRYHHHGGVTLFIAMSLDTLGVSPEQRAAVEKIRTDLHARMEPARAAEQNLMTTLADGLAAANLDTAKVDAAVAQVTAAAAAVHDASADALNELHAVLTPPQRAALVDKVEAHWAVWQKANAEETGAGEAGGRSPRDARDGSRPHAGPGGQDPRGPRRGDEGRAAARSAGDRDAPPRVRRRVPERERSTPERSPRRAPRTRTWSAGARRTWRTSSRP